MGLAGSVHLLQRCAHQELQPAKRRDNRKEKRRRNRSEEHLQVPSRIHCVAYATIARRNQIEEKGEGERERERER
jgi:hypothetical protein